jgi:hypothetical protein
MKYLDCTPSLHSKKNKNVVVWPNFDQHLIETELSENRQWKLIIENQIACVWAITFNDAEIWEERDCNDASTSIVLPHTLIFAVIILLKS